MVQSGDVRTSYRREGEGLPVLLLARESPADAPPPLLAVLGRHFRVHAPSISPPAVPGPPLCVAGWLHDLVDALGLQRPALVVEAEFAAAALAFVLSDPERVGRAVILHARETASPTPVAALAGRLDDEGPPLLLAGTEAGVLEGAALDEVVRFLSAAPRGEGGEGGAS